MPESNPWSDITLGPPGVSRQFYLCSRFYIFARIYFAIFVFLTGCLASYKWIQFIRENGLELSITQVCLGAQLLVSICTSDVVPSDIMQCALCGLSIRRIMELFIVNMCHC